jgi:hypothetical protein
MLTLPIIGKFYGVLIKSSTLLNIL